MHRRWPRASMMCRRFIVSGRVQGVYFRQSTQAESLRLGLTGYVRNLPDGSVEVIACGDPEPLAALEDWLWHGPPLARVDLVTVADIERESHLRFEIRR